MPYASTRNEYRAPDIDPDAPDSEPGEPQPLPDSVSWCLARTRTRIGGDNCPNTELEHEVVHETHRCSSLHAAPRAKTGRVHSKTKHNEPAVSPMYDI